MATVQMRLYGYERTLDFAAQKMLLGADIYPGITRAVRAPVMLPTRREKWTLLKSPHVHKTAQENFVRDTHKRLVVVNAKDSSTANAWVEYASRVMPPGVNVKATVTVLHRDISSLYRSPEVDGAFIGGRQDEKLSHRDQALLDRYHSVEAARFVEESLEKLAGAPELVRQAVALTEEADRLLARPREDFVGGSQPQQQEAKVVDGTEGGEDGGEAASSSEAVAEGGDAVSPAIARFEQLASEVEQRAESDGFMERFLAEDLDPAATRADLDKVKSFSADVRAGRRSIEDLIAELEDSGSAPEYSDPTTIRELLNAYADENDIARWR